MTPDERKARDCIFQDNVFEKTTARDTTNKSISGSQVYPSHVTQGQYSLEFDLYLHIPHIGVVTHRRLPRCGVKVSEIRQLTEFLAFIDSRSYDLYVLGNDDPLPSELLLRMDDLPGKFLSLRMEMKPGFDKIITRICSSPKTTSISQTLSCIQDGADITFAAAFLCAGKGLIDHLNFILWKYPEVAKQKSEYGRSLLHAASAGNQEKVIDSLVHSGIDIEAQDLASITPLEVAIDFQTYNSERRLRLHFWRLKKLNMTSCLNLVDPPQPSENASGKHTVKANKSRIASREIDKRRCNKHVNLGISVMNVRPTVTQVPTGSSHIKSMDHPHGLTTEIPFSDIQKVASSKDVKSAEETPNVDHKAHRILSSKSWKKQKREGDKEKEGNNKYLPNYIKKKIPFDKWLQQKITEEDNFEDSETDSSDNDIVYPQPGKSLTKEEFFEWNKSKFKNSNGKIKNNSTSKKCEMNKKDKSRSYETGVFRLTDTGTCEKKKKTKKQDDQMYDFRRWKKNKLIKERSKHKKNVDNILLGISEKEETLNKNLPLRKKQLDALKKNNKVYGALYTDWMDEKFEEKAIKKIQDMEEDEELKRVREREETQKAKMRKYILEKWREKVKVKRKHDKGIEEHFRKYGNNVGKCIENSIQFHEKDKGNLEIDESQDVNEEMRKEKEMTYLKWLFQKEDELIKVEETQFDLKKRELEDLLERSKS